MQGFDNHRFHPQLRELVVEASLALARLDAERLEELAFSCRALNRDLGGRSDAQRRELERQALDASGDMAVFGRVLDATRANLEVGRRLRQRGDGHSEYTAGLAGAAGPWALAEKNHGHN